MSATSHTEAQARVTINRLLAEAGWRLETDATHSRELRTVFVAFLLDPPSATPSSPISNPRFPSRISNPSCVTHPSYGDRTPKEGETLT